MSKRDHSSMEESENAVIIRDKEIAHPGMPKSVKNANIAIPDSMSASIISADGSVRYHLQDVVLLAHPYIVYLHTPDLHNRNDSLTLAIEQGQEDSQEENGREQWAKQ